MANQTSSPARTADKTALGLAYQQCLSPACAATYAVDQALFSCPICGDLLDVVYEWDRLPVLRRLADFESKWAARHDSLNFSGVWRFRELLPFAPPELVVTIGEGQTLLQARTRSAATSASPPAGCGCSTKA